MATTKQQQPQGALVQALPEPPSYNKLSDSTGVQMEGRSRSSKEHRRITAASSTKSKTGDDYASPDMTCTTPGKDPTIPLKQVVNTGRGKPAPWVVKIDYDPTPINPAALAVVNSPTGKASDGSRLLRTRRNEKRKNSPLSSPNNSPSTTRSYDSRIPGPIRNVQLTPRPRYDGSGSLTEVSTSGDSALFPLQQDESYFFIGGLRYLDQLIPDHFPLPIEVNLDESVDSPANPPSCCTRSIRTCHRIDSTVSYTIHRQSWGVVLDTFILFWAQAFSCWFVPLTFTLSCVFIDPASAMTLLVAGILTPVTNSSLKSFFVRPRPDERRLGHKTYNLRTALKNHSFPSGDSAIAGCWSAGMVKATGTFIPWFATPLAMFGRIYFGCHYVCDTLVGASMGIGIFYLTDACNDQILYEAENDADIREWFRRFIFFCLIPACSVVTYYLWLCAKGYRSV